MLPILFVDEFLKKLPAGSTFYAIGYVRGIPSEVITGLVEKITELGEENLALHIILNLPSGKKMRSYLLSKALSKKFFTKREYAEHFLICERAAYHRRLRRAYERATATLQTIALMYPPEFT